MPINTWWNAELRMQRCGSEALTEAVPADGTSANVRYKRLGFPQTTRTQERAPRENAE